MLLLSSDQIGDAAQKAVETALKRPKQYREAAAAKWKKGEEAAAAATKRKKEEEAAAVAAAKRKEEEAAAAAAAAAKRKKEEEAAAAVAAAAGSPVGRWLAKVGLDKEYAELFYRHELTEEAHIASLDNAFLVDLGVSTAGHRLRLVSGLKLLGGAGAAAGGGGGAGGSSVGGGGGGGTQEHPTGSLTLANSAFKTYYTAAEPPEFADELLRALRELLSAYFAARSLPATSAANFFRDLQKEAFGYPSELLDEVPAAAQRLWTSALKPKDVPPSERREFCSMLNEAIRSRDKALAAPAAVLTRGINELCVVRKRKTAEKLPFAKKTYRGGGLPDEYRAFFAEGKHFRVPNFLATSSAEDTAIQFAYNAHNGSGLPAIIWTFEFDPRGETSFQHRCKHVNLVQRSNCPGEDEFLFAPFSPFIVKSVAWSPAPTDLTPHRVTLSVITDSRTEPEDLPSAPWC